MADVRQRPTRRQLEVLRAYVATGSIARAAHELDISESTVRQHLSGLYRRAGCQNAAQAAYVLGSHDLAERWSARTRAPARLSQRPSGGDVPGLYGTGWVKEAESAR